MLKLDGPIRKRPGAVEWLAAMARQPIPRIAVLQDNAWQQMYLSG